MVSCFIIAEAGVNHNGNVETAKALADAAANAGADAVKFQTFRATEIATAGAPKARYQAERDTDSTSQRDMLARLELDEAAHRAIALHCEAIGIEFLSSPFGVADLQLLVAVGVRAIKLGSGEITNLPLLRAACESGLPIYMSTGMSTLGDVADAITAMDVARDRLTLLHCLSAYPAPPSEINLRAMHALEAAFGLPVGFSDHTLGVEIAVAAVALGARVIEKHLTLDRAAPGPDHAASLEPDQFAQMVTAIRAVQAARGDGWKRVMPSEAETRSVVRKSIVASRDISCGAIFDGTNLTTKRPGTGISPMLLDAVIGRRATRDILSDELLVWADCE